MKRKLYILCTILASIGLLFSSCDNSQISHRGSCGSKLKWELTDGILLITGTGKMTDWKNNNGAPWHKYQSSINSVYIGEGVTSIGERAFSGCRNIKSVAMPNSLTSIGVFSFSECFTLASVDIPDNVTSIGYGAFYRCNNVNTLNIGRGMMNIEDGAFNGCSLLSITCRAVTPPTLGGDIVFLGVYRSIPLYIPAESVPAYRSAKGWNEFTNIIGLR